MARACRLPAAMTDGPRVPGFTAGLALSLGLVGVFSGAAGLLPRPLPAAEDLGPAATSEELLESLSAETMRAASRAPYRRALSAANILVSALLAFGSALTLAGRASAPWWLTQGIAANALWTVAAAASDVHALWAHRDVITGIGARISALSGASAALDGAGALWGQVGFVGTVLLIKLFLYAALFRQVRRARPAEP